MTSRSRTPVPAQDHGIVVPQPSDPAHLGRGYGQGSHPLSGSQDVDTADFAAAEGEQQPHANNGAEEDLGRSHDEATLVGAGGTGLSRSNTNASQYHSMTPSRHGTLKKKASVSRKGSLRRSGSRRSSRPGSVYGMSIGESDRYDGEDEQMHSPFYSPVPTTGSPTEILANRFQSWRKVLKDLITYFREVQASYDARSKSLLKLSNVVNNINVPPVFLTEGGIYDATHILRDFHKQSTVESNKARDIENDVIIQLSGLRSDLNQKIKEIKALAGDFKNSVEKEMEGTRRALMGYQESLSLVDSDPAAIAGKGDPYIVRLAVDRQLERQIDEENYLHRAFLNLESSGRELESIVVGEIQKAYNAYAGVLKREADEAYDAVEKLRSGPVSLPKDHEWNVFVERDQHFVDPRLPLRKVVDIDYPGKDHPSASEVRSGMLERKSKYLKSYTPGWYVLSPTHLHEFKSADHIQSQQPVMSLFLPDQKLGSHSGPDSSSHKFILKGRQTGSMHRGHSWVFRAESHETMLAWYSDIKNLTEKTGEERNAFVRRHARSISGGSYKSASISSDGGLEEDEADHVPYSAHASSVDHAPKQETVERPQPGGRFPSDIQVDRDLQAPLSPSSGASDDHDVLAAAASLPGSGVPAPGPQPPPQNMSQQYDREIRNEPNPTPGEDSYFPIIHAPTPRRPAMEDQGAPLEQAISNPNLPEPVEMQSTPLETSANQAPSHQTSHAASQQTPHEPQRHASNYGEWLAPAAAGTTVIAGEHSYDREHVGPLKSEEQDAKADPSAQNNNAGNATSAGPDQQQLTVGALARQESSSSAKADALNTRSSAGSDSTDPTTIDHPVEASAQSSAYPLSFSRADVNYMPNPMMPPSGYPLSFSPGAGQADYKPHATAAASQRPGVPHSSKSVQSASELHVPGEYPPTPAL